jgi:Na+/phosphate symporter
VIVTQLGGGLALFLYGMRKMTEALKTVAGDGMKRLLARLTTNRFAAALAGGVVTAVIQSSSVTTVLVVGFISAGLLQFGQSVGVILVANVGTTVTAQIIAFQVYKYGLVLIAAGFFTEILGRRERVRQWGSGDPDLALEVLESKSVVIGLAEEASVHIASRLVAEEPHRLETYQTETDIIEIYRRLNTLSRRIARLSIDASIRGLRPDTSEET